MSTTTVDPINLDGYPVATIHGEHTTFGALAGGRAVIAAIEAALPAKV